MLENLRNIVSLFHVAVQHAADEVNALIAHGEGHAEVAVHDFVNAVKGILLVDDCVQENAEGPDILLLAAIWLSCEDFWCGVVCNIAISFVSNHMAIHKCE